MRRFEENAKKQRTATRPLAFNYYYLPFLCICLIGLASSVYLGISHYRIHTDPTYSSFCAVSRALNCDTVSTSPYAVLFNLPMALWGVLGYLFVMVVLIAAGYRKFSRKRFWPLLFWIALAYSFGSLVLAWISSVRIHSYCIMCILTYVVNFVLLYYAWFINRRFGDEGLFRGLIEDVRTLWGLKKNVIPFAAGFLLTISGLVAAMPTYWKMPLPELNESIAQGVTDDGYPWIGAENPTLTIQEFSDYMCFQCKKMHFLLRRLVESYPDQIRLVHRHFPMDHLYNPLVTDKFHSGSGKMSIIALYATYKGQFWKVNDYFFDIAEQQEDFNTRTIADLIGVPAGELSAALKSRSLRLRLKHDIAVGIDQGVIGTPGFIINGKVYLATIPKEVLQLLKSNHGK